MLGIQLLIVPARRRHSLCNTGPAEEENIIAILSMPDIENTEKGHRTLEVAWKI